MVLPVSELILKFGLAHLGKTRLLPPGPLEPGTSGPAHSLPYVCSLVIETLDSCQKMSLRCRHYPQHFDELPRHTISIYRLFLTRLPVLGIQIHRHFNRGVHMTQNSSVSDFKVLLCVFWKLIHILGSSECFKQGAQKGGMFRFLRSWPGCGTLQLEVMGSGFWNPHEIPVLCHIKSVAGDNIMQRRHRQCCVHLVTAPSLSLNFFLVAEF